MSGPLAPIPPTRPRVVYFISAFNRGGAEQGLVRLVRDGAFEGLDLTIVSIARGSGEPLADLAALGAQVVVFDRGAKMTPLAMALALPRMVRLLQRLRPRALILSLPQANIVGRIAAMAVKPEIVASFEHNTHLSKPVFEEAYRRTSSVVNWLVADARTTAVEAQRRLYTTAPDSTVVLPLVSFPPDPPPPFNPRGEPLRLVNAARFTAVKNQIALVRAVDILRQRGIEVRLDLHGEGPERAACEALAKELGLGGQVRLPGYTDAWWKGERYDLFVLSSRHEGLCIAALEAMAQAVTLVAPGIGGLLDYGTAANMQRLPDVEPESIADAVERLARDPARREALGRAGYATVQARFGEAAVKATYRAFAASLARPGGVA